MQRVERHDPVFAQCVEHGHEHHPAASARCIGDNRAQRADRRQEPQRAQQLDIERYLQPDRRVKREEHHAADERQAVSRDR